MSHLVETLLFQMQAAKLPDPVLEHRFHPTRRWRFDIAYPDKMVAIEVEGGTWTGGRHIRGSGFGKDCVKYNAATLMDWKVLRFTGDMIKSGSALNIIESAIKSVTPDDLREKGAI